MVPVCNQPIIEHIFGLLKRHGIEEVVATLYYQADEIQSYFGDGSDHGSKLHYSIESIPLGTAGSVKKAQHLLDGETFFIVSGDALTDCNLQKALDFHRAKKSLATLILYRVSSPLEFGVVVTDDEGQVVRFLEKPSWSEVFSDTVNTGMYILEPEIFQHMEDNIAYDWSSDIFPKLLDEGLPIYGYVMDGYWTDIGSLQQYREAQDALMSGEVQLDVAGIRAPNDQIIIGRNCVIDDTADLIAPVCIGNNCKIKKGARVGPFTSIGNNSHIEQNAHVQRSVVWESSYIGPNVGVHSAIVCSKVTIKLDSQIREDVVIGDRCFIDVGTTVRPRVKIWPDKIVERGSIVTMSLVWGSTWRGSLFRELGVAGLSNVEITPDFACRLGSSFGSIFPPGSRIVTSRDSTRSSRMIKRALISSLLSSGCTVLDLRSAALPVVRHFIATSGAAAAINVRKFPGNTRMTLIEMFDETGAYISRPRERKVESAFFREDYPRADPDDLGQIEFVSRAVEEYQDHYMSLLNPCGGKRLRIVCDYGYSSLALIFPAMLAKLGVESMSLNAYNDAKLAPRTDDHIGEHMANLRQIVGTLGYDMGVLFTQEGERLTVVDDRGQILAGNRLLATLGILMARAKPSARIALSVTAPTALEEALIQEGATVIRTKADVRSLMNASIEKSVDFAGDHNGGFIFPAFHPGFDAAFSFGMLVTMLQRQGVTISQIAKLAPEFHMAREQVRVPYDSKGTVMRQLTEENAHTPRVELLDGIKIYEEDAWVLVLPDSIEPLFNIYAESATSEHSQAMVKHYAQKIESMV
ncbi:mannose-1-phosphate guanyltransferase [soil metagenome]